MKTAIATQELFMGAHIKISPCRGLASHFKSWEELEQTAAEDVYVAAHYAEEGEVVILHNKATVVDVQLPIKGIEAIVFGVLKEGLRIISTKVPSPSSEAVEWVIKKQGNI